MTAIHNPYTGDLIDTQLILNQTGGASSGYGSQITVGSDSGAIILCDTASGNMQVVLIGNEGDMKTIKKTADDENIVSIVPNNGTIEGEASLELEGNDSVTIKFVSGNWIII